MEPPYKTRAYKEKKYGRPTRHALVAAPKAVQVSAVRYRTLPYRTLGFLRGGPPYRAALYRTAVTYTKKAPRLARFLYINV